MTRILTPADYGVMLLIGNGAALINLLFGFGLAQALPTLFSNAETDPSRRAISTTIILSIGGILSALYLATALLSREISVFFLHTPSYSGVIALGALSAFLNACSLCLAIIVRLTEKHKLYPIVQIPALILQVSLIGWFVASASLTIKSQYIATTLAGLFTTTAYLFVLRYWLTGQFQIRKLTAASRIGLQMLPWQIAVLLATSSAAFFLTRAGHVNDSGLFLVASGAAGLLVVVSGSFESVWTPFVLRRKDEPDIAKTQIRIFSLYSATLLMAAAMLCVFAHELFVVLAGPAFRSGYLFVPGLAIAYCLFCFVNGFAQGLQARQRTIHYAWIGAIASVVFLAAALSLTANFGAWGI
ncbi:MAG: O-antigen/teichoic acid export membrane protein, partial [Afipia broomeae]